MTNPVDSANVGPIRYYESKPAASVPPKPEPPKTETAPDPGVLPLVIALAAVAAATL